MANLQIILYSPDEDDLFQRVGEGIHAVKGYNEMGLRTFTVARDLGELSARIGGAAVKADVHTIMIVINAHGDVGTGVFSGMMLGETFAISPDIFMNGLNNVPRSGTSPFTGLNNIFLSITQRLIVVSGQCWGSFYSNELEALSTLGDRATFVGLAYAETYSATAGLKDYLNAVHLEISTFLWKYLKGNEILRSLKAQYPSLTIDFAN